MNVRIIDIMLPLHTSGEQRNMIVCEHIKTLSNVFVHDLAEELCSHYQTIALSYWKDEYMKSLMPRMTHCTIAIKNEKVGGVMLYVEKPSLVYIRTLCSNDHCGGFLLKHIMAKYPQRTIATNADVGVVGFYEKFGFTVMKYMPLEKGKYPYMIRKTPSGDHDDFFAIFKHLFNFDLNW